MTTSEELAHLLFAQLADPNRTESDLTLITRMMDSVTQERDKVNALMRGSMDLVDQAGEIRRLERQLATAQAKIGKLEKRWHDACTHDYDIDLLAQVEAINQQLAAVQARCAQYDELIMAVASKYPNETRHQTALRYIQERESRHCSGPAQATQTERPPA